MYKFKRIYAPGFVLVESRQEAGQSHVKRFAPGTTPKNQGTLNLYLAGQFSFSIPSAGFGQVMQPGQTNLDLGIDEFPAGVDAIETAMTDDCWRMCMSPEKKGSRWSRRVVDLAPGDAISLAAGEVAVVLSGPVKVAADGHSVGSVIHGLAGATIEAVANSRVATAKIL